MMQHERYLATIEYDPDADSFYGRAANVRRGGFDFWGTSVEELRREFAASAHVFEETLAEQGESVEFVDAPGLRRRAAAELGAARSEAKAAAARANGKKGGRPRKNAMFDGSQGRDPFPRVGGVETSAVDNPRVVHGGFGGRDGQVGDKATIRARDVVEHVSGEKRKV